MDHHKTPFSDKWFAMLPILEPVEKPSISIVRLGCCLFPILWGWHITQWVMACWNWFISENLELSWYQPYFSDITGGINVSYPDTFQWWMVCNVSHLETCGKKTNCPKSNGLTVSWRLVYHWKPSVMRPVFFSIMSLDVIIVPLVLIIM